MDNLYWLEQIKPSDCTLVGDRALHLSQLMQRGYPVLSGFVISAPAWRQFLAHLDSIAAVAELFDAYRYLDVDDDRQLQQIAQALRYEIHNASIPDWFDAVVKAIAHWDTSLMSLCLVSPPGKDDAISGLWEAQISTNASTAISAVLQTWGQLFRARSLLYWQRARVDLRQLDVAVLVQPLPNAIAGGILNIQATTAEIQACFGLGVAIARKEVLPDLYSVDLATGQVRSQALGNKMIAYNLFRNRVDPELRRSPTEFAEVPADYLQSTLSLPQQQEYALKQGDLQQLIALAQQLSPEVDKALRVEWMLSPPEDHEASHLYITQVSETLTTTTIAPTTPQMPLRGLAAAPGRLIAPAYVITDIRQKPAPPAGVILVAPEITPDWLPLLQQVGGFITEQGGLTSHSAILARELGLPAVVNVAKATQLLQTGDLLDLNGSYGEIERVNSQTKIGDRIEQNSTVAQIAASRFTPDSIALPIATQLLVNLSQPVLRLTNLPVDGVGLLRSELMLLNVLEGQDLHQWLQYHRRALIDRWREQVVQIARAFAPKPVFYRALDWRSQQVQLLVNNASTSKDSRFGQVISYLQNPTFDLELAVLAEVQQAGCDNVRLILPFIRTVEEFSFCRRRVEQVGLFQQPQFQLWIMAEVPSVLFLIPEYVKAGVQGVSIGTNDLTQLLFGVDRDLGTSTTMFDARHPVVMRAIAQIIHHAKLANIPCSICGQAPVLYPELIDSLVRWGITAISVDFEAVERTYQAIARAEQRLLVAAAQNQLSSSSIPASDAVAEFGL